MSDQNHKNAYELREQIRTFVQLFGLHEQHQTPCGQPLTVPHAHALMVLLEEDGLRIAELGEHLNIDKSNVSRLCARMDEAGHLERRPCSEDARAKRLWLTNEGRELAGRVNQASIGRFSQIVARVEDTEVEQIVGALELLNNSLIRSVQEDK
ncbi:MAG: MarR family winged helix-turn-helix transcriptional regulator [Persicimonas sp.]